MGGNQDVRSGADALRARIEAERQDRGTPGDVHLERAMRYVRDAEALAEDGSQDAAVALRIASALLDVVVASRRRAHAQPPSPLP